MKMVCQYCITKTAVQFFVLVFCQALRGYSDAAMYCYEELEIDAGIYDDTQPAYRYYGTR